MSKAGGNSQERKNFNITDTSLILPLKTASLSKLNPCPKHRLECVLTDLPITQDTKTVATTFSQNLCIFVS